MKKLYITLVRTGALFFALIVGLIVTQSNACDCSCFFRCMGEQNQVQQITTHVTPPAAQTMPEPASAQTLQPDPVLEKVKRLPTPATATLTLTRYQLSAVRKPSREAPQELPTVDENKTASAATISISPAFQARNKMVKPIKQNPKRILLDAIKARKKEIALQLLDSGTLTAEQLTVRSSEGKTPFLYAIRHEYWDIADKLVRLNVPIPDYDDIRTVVSPEREPEKYKRCLIGYASLCFTSL